MNKFEFTNEEIIYIFSHFDEHIEGIKSQLDKQLKYAQAQLKVYKDVYGNEPDFDEENHVLYSKLLNEEIPALTAKRLVVLEGIRDKFRHNYELMFDLDPEFVEKVKKDLFTASDAIVDLVEQIKNKEDNDYEN